MIKLEKYEIETIKKMEGLMELPDEVAKEKLENNEYGIDLEIESVTFDYKNYIIELRVCSGDLISPAFWGEATLCDYNGEEIYTSDPLDTFKEFSLFYNDNDELFFEINFEEELVNVR